MTRFARSASLLALAIAPFIEADALAGPRGDKIVTMEGRAAGANANAMEQAKQDALRRAVEQACGTFITGQTKIKNYQAVYDKALSQAVGYVTEFSIVSEKVEGGVSYCTVKATVSTKSFEIEWARLLHTLDVEENPRCIVVIVEDNDPNDSALPKTDGVVQSVLENVFVKRGVQLMDRGASEDARKRDLDLAAINNDVNKLAATGAAFKADVVIRGNAESRRAGSSPIGGRTVYRWSATINIRAYHTDSAQLLMSNSYSLSHSTMGAEAGGDDALRKCAEENADNILRDIAEAWRKRQNVRRICQVVLENCSRKDYKAFEDAMKQVDGVQSVRMRELVNNICQAEIDWSYDLERLVGRIEELKVPGTSYEVTEQTHDRVTVKLVR